MDLRRRVERLEERLADLKDTVADLSRRLPANEPKALQNGSQVSLAKLKEMALFAAICFLFGAMWATGDPAGAAKLVSKVLVAK